jgi:hypothetical protein
VNSQGSAARSGLRKHQSCDSVARGEIQNIELFNSLYDDREKFHEDNLNICYISEFIFTPLS